MKGYALWCNAQQKWWTTSKCFSKSGIPFIWGRKSNAESRKRDQLYWANRFGGRPPMDLRIVEITIAPVDNKHLV